jgi:hypothetical protein
MLPRDVIDIDQLLAERAPEHRRPLERRPPDDTEWLRLLQHHRWRWTLDQSNPKRVSLPDYARAVGEDLTRIDWDLEAYEARREAADAASREPLTAPRD